MMIDDVITIAASGTQSTYLDVRGSRNVGLVLPALDSTLVTVMGSMDGVTGYPVLNEALSANLVTGSAIVGAKCINVPNFPFKWVGILCGTAQTGGERSIRVVGK